MRAESYWMFEEMLERELMVLSTKELNMGIYIKMKESGKLQIISNRSRFHEHEGLILKKFRLTMPEDIKKVLREGETFFYSFDVSNFYKY